MNNFEKINMAITPEDLLNIMGYTVHSGRNIKCPIHGDNNSGENFRIFGDTWKCFSRGCGEPHSRDTVNLYCLITYGVVYPQLDSANKNNVLDFFKQYIDLNNYAAPKNRLLAKLTQQEYNLIKKYFLGLTNIAECCNIKSANRLYNQFKLFFTILENADNPPKNWQKQFTDYIGMSYFFEEIK